MTDVLDRLRAADPAAALGQLVTDAQLQAWCDAGLREVLSRVSPSVAARPAVPPAVPSSGEGPVLPGQRRAVGRPGLPDRSDAPGAPSAATDLAVVRSRRRRLVSAGRRWWLPAAGVAAAVLLAVTVGLPGRPAPAMAATPAVLHYAQVASTSKSEAEALASRSLARQRLQRTAPEAFTVRWHEWSLSTRVDGRQVTSAVVPVQVALTRRADGSAELVRRTAAPQFPDRQSRERWEQDGRPAERPVEVEHQQWAAGGYAQEAAALPDDPARLLPVLAATHPIAKLGDAEVLVAIADAYRSAQLSPAQQAALFAVAASRPGLEPFGRVTDRAGRLGYALSVESDHTGLPTRYTAIFDPVTGRLLDLEQTLTRTAGSLNVPVPSTIGYTVFD